MMSKPTQTPEKLTIQCILNILSEEDQTTLENKVWNERMESLWLGEIAEGYEPSRKRLVTARSQGEAMHKLLSERFWDFNQVGLYGGIKIGFFRGEIPKFTKDMTVEEYLTIMDGLMVDENGKRIYRLDLPDEYSVTRLSKIKTIT